MCNPEIRTCMTAGDAWTSISSLHLCHTCPDLDPKYPAKHTCSRLASHNTHMLAGEGGFRRQSPVERQATEDLHTTDTWVLDCSLSCCSLTTTLRPVMMHGPRTWGWSSHRPNLLKAWPEKTFPLITLPGAFRYPMDGWLTQHSKESEKEGNKGLPLLLKYKHILHSAPIITLDWTSSWLKHKIFIPRYSIKTLHIFLFIVLKIDNLKYFSFTSADAQINQGRNTEQFYWQCSWISLQQLPILYVLERNLDTTKPLCSCYLCVSAHHAQNQNSNF